LQRIVYIQLHGLQQRLAERHIALELGDSAKELLIEAGYDPVYGVRPLKRAIQRKVLDPLAMRVLAGEFHDGDHILVDKTGNDLVFARRVSAEAVA
jgi:ATP-dependent Clp protease ATP-binding subunit ClpB